MWQILHASSKQGKDQSVREAWCCCILHNMLIRYRKLVNHVGLTDEFTAWLVTVEAELLLQEADRARYRKKVSITSTAEGQARRDALIVEMKTLSAASHSAV